MNDLDDRQKQLLLAVIQAFMDTATAVGSVEISDRYDFDLSPATIRNEMADLVKRGYLYKTHQSAGRIPTTQAWRFYITEALDEEEVNTVKGAEARERLFSSKFSLEKLMKEAISALSDFSGYTTLCIVNGNIFHSGITKLLDHVEFKNLDQLHKLLLVLEDIHTMGKIFSKAKGESDVYILIGEELGIESMKEAAVAFSRIRIHGIEDAYICVVGPARMTYSKVLPALKYIEKNLYDATKGI